MSDSRDCHYQTPVLHAFEADQTVGKILYAG